MALCLVYCLQAWEPHFKKGAGEHPEKDQYLAKNCVFGEGKCLLLGRRCNPERRQEDDIMERIPALHKKDSVFK